jgi:hypothetical protein
VSTPAPPCSTGAPTTCSPRSTASPGRRLVLGRPRAADRAAFRRLIDFQADDRFYRTKGELYAYARLLRELGKDIESVIRERGLQTVWSSMLENLFQAAELHPWVVVNGAPDSQALPSHLAAQGFFLLRARAQMYELMDILTK